jgi:ABC-type multidrug transport system fused ATPase/permease subunit
MYDPTEGRILLDGVDIRDLKLETLRDKIGVVSQEVNNLMTVLL